MTSNYAILQKDELISKLKYLVLNDSAWLTNDDISSIEAKIDELDCFINERYKQHGC